MSRSSGAQSGFLLNRIEKMLLGAMMRGRLGLGCRAALSASGIGFPQASRVLLAAGLFLGAGTAGATSQTGSPKPKEVPWEDETGCTGEGAVAFALIKRAIFESTGFPHPSENYLKCEDVISLPFAPFGKNAVVQVRNETFCKEGYCQTFIYNRHLKSIMFSLEAEKKFEVTW
ncbi:MAG TPA: hypothetical protein VHG30_03120 [Microvirga sp.]|nr:hypothetical protein [Microvirga sp.]